MNSTIRRSRARLIATAGIASACPAALTLLSAPLLAQTSATLPPIVVEGGTLAPAKPASKPAQSAEPSPPPASSSASTSAGGGSAQSSSPAIEAPVSANSGDAASGRGAAAGLPAEQLGSAVSVVTGEQLRARQIRHAGEALRNLPGVSVNRVGNSASLTEVRIRGAESNHTLVLIDGIEANAASEGIFDFSDLSVDDIERIEVIRGPQSALYGSNAVGGVVNIVTRSGRGPARVTARFEGGSMRTLDGAVSVSGGNERAWGALSVHANRSDGFNIAPAGPLGEDDGSRLKAFAARAGVMLTDTMQLNLSVRRTEKYGQRDDQTGLSVRDGLVIASDSLSVLRASTLLMGAELRWDMLDGRLTHILKGTRNQTRREDIQDADFGFGFGFPAEYLNESEAHKIGYQATYRFATPLLLSARHALTGLVEHERERFDVTSLFGGAVKADRSRDAVAGEWHTDLAETVYLTAGLRHDMNERLEDFTTWRTAVSVPLRAVGLRPHASVGTAVKLPSMFEQFGQTANFLPNPALKPERSFGWDAGVELSLLGGTALLDVTYFEADLKDKITTVFLPGFVSSVVNLPGKSERRGIEVSARAKVASSLDVGLSYTYLDATESTGVRELRRPPHSGRADVAYAFDDRRGLVSLGIGYNGRMDDTVFAAPFFFPASRLTLEHYWLVSAAASYKVAPGVELTGRVENLLDANYEEAFGFASAGLAVYTGIRLTYDDGLTLSGRAQ